jgi:hypothetical protein
VASLDTFRIIETTDKNTLSEGMNYAAEQGYILRDFHVVGLTRQFVEGGDTLGDTKPLFVAVMMLLSPLPQTS